MKRALALAILLVGPPAGAKAPQESAPEPEPVASRDIDIDAELDPEVDGCVRALATVHIDAPPGAVRDAILDLQARVTESWIVDSVDVYREHKTRSRTHRAAKWTLSVMGVEIIYHTVYDWNASTREVNWHLDPDRTNDLRRAVGRYKLRPSGKNGTKLVYTFEVGTKRKVPLAIRRRITKRSVRELLDSVRRRAES